MPAFQDKPWSDNPNAPQITYRQYLTEKSWFAGGAVSSILYGIWDPRLHVCLSVLTSFVRFMLGMLIMLFFKCMIALFNPVHRRSDRTKWGLVSYTLVTFSLATVLTAMNLYIQSISFIDNRDSPGGPHGYLQLRYYNVINVVPNAAFCVNNWLADGLLVSSLFGAVSNRTGPNACSSSSIVVTRCTPGTSGSSPFPASCTLALWVRI